MSAVPLPQDSAAELEQICRDAETQEAAHDEAMRRKPEANPETVARQISAIWARLYQERRPLPMNTIEANGPLFIMPAVIDRDVDAVMMEASANADYSPAAGAEIFTRRHRDHIRRNRQKKRWLVWTGKQWQENQGDMVLDAIDHFGKIYGQAALQAYEGKAGVGLQRQISTYTFQNSILKIIENKQELQIDSDELNRNPWLLNTPEEIIDLRTGETMPHDPAHLCTKMTSVAPASPNRLDAEFAKSRFKSFLDEVFANAPESERTDLLDFHQQILGYCLTGDSSLHFLLFWFGDGRNGKSTLGEILLYVFGSYGKKAAASVLLSSRNESHPTDIASLEGSRLVISSEITEGAYWHESRIKEITGDARLAARRMRCDWHEFIRTHKQIVYANSKPRIRATDPAIKSRIKMVEFGTNFEANGQLDPELKGKLEAEAPLILAWLIQGAVRLFRNGLRLPRCSFVERQSEEYLADNDFMSLWLEERCVVGEQKPNGDKNRERPGVLYQDFSAWRKERGEHPEAIQRFSQLLTARGFQSVRVNGQKHFDGISLAF